LSDIAFQHQLAGLADAAENQLCFRDHLRERDLSGCGTIADDLTRERLAHCRRHAHPVKRTRQAMPQTIA
jgi:hypothetical protein